MKKFKVTIPSTRYAVYEVEAPSEEEAEEVVYETAYDEGETEILHSETDEPEEIK